MSDLLPTAEPASSPPVPSDAETLVHANPAPLRLTRTRKQAGQSVKNQIKIGSAIRDQRISDMHELDQARVEKQEWVTRTTEMLDTLFSDSSVSERVNDWVGPILPEYAEFGMFVELFGHEMRHRIGRLQAVLKMIEETPEPQPQAQPSTNAGPAYVDASEARPASQRSTGAAASSAVAPAPQPRRSARASSAATHPTETILLLGRGDANDPDSEQRSREVDEFLGKLGMKTVTPDPSPAGLAEVLESHRDAAFAVVLAPTGAGDALSGNADFQFDLGCCVGRLGPARITLLRRGGPIEDHFRGVRQIALDATAGWQLALARVLKSAGITVDLNRLL
jgi:hypothetical protein